MNQAHARHLIVLFAVGLSLALQSVAGAVVLVEENFETLSVGSPLTGQDSWLTHFNRSAVVATGGGVNPTTIASTSAAAMPSNNSTGNRKVVSNFGLTTSDVVALNFDARVAGTNNYDTSMFGIGNNVAGAQMGPHFGIQFGRFGVRGDNLGTLTNSTNFLPVANTWYRIASQWDLNGQTATLWVRDLSGTDPNVSDTTYTQIFFDANRAVSKANINGLTNLANWNEARLRLGGDTSAAAGSGAADNLFAQTTTVLADYRFNNAGTLNLSSDSNLYTTASSFVAGSGISLAASGLGNPPGSGFTSGNAAVTANLASAIVANDYYTFSVNPQDPRAVLSLTSLMFDVQRESASSPLNYALFAQVGGAWSGGTLVGEGLFSATVGDSNTNFFNFGVYLADFDFLQDFQDTVMFRLYLYGGANSPSSLNDIRIDNVVLRGSLFLIPEPSSFALWGLALAVGGPFVRRRRRAFRSLSS